MDTTKSVDFNRLYQRIEIQRTESDYFYWKIEDKYSEVTIGGLSSTLDKALLSIKSKYEQMFGTALV